MHTCREGLYQICINIGEISNSLFLFWQLYLLNFDGALTLSVPQMVITYQFHANTTEIWAWGPHYKIMRLAETIGNHLYNTSIFIRDHTYTQENWIAPPVKCRASCVAALAFVCTNKSEIFYPNSLGVYRTICSSMSSRVSTSMSESCTIVPVSHYLSILSTLLLHYLLTTSGTAKIRAPIACSIKWPCSNTATDTYTLDLWIYVYLM